MSSVNRHPLRDRTRATAWLVSLVIGWVGYDAKVRWLPPEHFLVLEFRDALWEACCGGELARCGPDGKLIVRLREDDDGFALVHVLDTLEHPEALSVCTVAQGVDAVLSRHYDCPRAAGWRWAARWRDMELLLNPDGPLSDAGSRKDNGQTGRKLVMDYYGLRVPRELAMDVVKCGAGECMVRAVYAPNLAEPLDVQVEGGDASVQVERRALRRSGPPRVGIFMPYAADIEVVRVVPRR